MRTAMLPVVFRCPPWMIGLPFTLLMGAITTVTVAWACAVWSPTQLTFDPLQNSAEARETVSPDGEVGLYYQEAGFGWVFMYLRGQRSSSHGKGDVFWAGPYGGTYHRLAGWPFYALRSRVEVLDSQVANRVREGQPKRDNEPQRTKWDLPWREILQRGFASKDLPAWFHAQPNRRLPLIPVPWGLAGNAVLYATGFFLAERLGQFAWRTARHAEHAASVGGV